MAALITNITSLVTAAVDWITSIVGCITASGNELLLLFVLFGFVGTGIGLVKRILSVN